MANKKLIYLASPYTAATPEARELNYQRAVEATAYLTRMFDYDIVLYSPIVHSHPLDIILRYPHSKWMEICEVFYKRCDGMLVLCSPGWIHSKGVQKEIEWAQRDNKPMNYYVSDNDGGYIYAPGSDFSALWSDE